MDFQYNLPAGSGLFEFLGVILDLSCRERVVKRYLDRFSPVIFTVVFHKSLNSRLRGLLFQKLETKDIIYDFIEKNSLKGSLLYSK